MLLAQTALSATPGDAQLGLEGLYTKVNEIKLSAGCWDADDVAFNCGPSNAGFGVSVLFEIGTWAPAGEWTRPDSLLLRVERRDGQRTEVYEPRDEDYAVGPFITAKLEMGYSQFSRVSSVGTITDVQGAIRELPFVSFIGDLGFRDQACLNTTTNALAELARLDAEKVTASEARTEAIQEQSEAMNDVLSGCESARWFGVRLGFRSGLIQMHNVEARFPGLSADDDQQAFIDEHELLDSYVAEGSAFQFGFTLAAYGEFFGGLKLGLEAGYMWRRFDSVGWSPRGNPRIPASLPKTLTYTGGQIGAWVSLPGPRTGR